MQLQLWMRKEEVPAGSHICHLYPRSKGDEVTQVATSLLISGADARYRCVYLGPTQEVEDIATALHKAGTPVDKMRESGQLIISDQRDSYLLHGRFEPYHLLSNHMTAIRQAQIDGWRGAALAIDMQWLTDGVGNNALTLKYEALCDAVFTFQQQPIVAIAQYSLDKLGADMAVEMNKLHPLSIQARHLRRNPNYVNSEQYLKNFMRSPRQAR